MKKLQSIILKNQKRIIIGGLIIAFISFIYALGYMTDLYPLWYYTDFGSSRYVSGSEVFLDGQTFNRVLFYLTLTLIVTAASMLVYFSQKRHYYYLSNYITIGINAGLTFGIGATIFVGNILLRTFFMEVDFEKYKEVAADQYTDSTFIFDIGFVLAVVMMVWAIALFLLCRYKSQANKAERMANEEVANG